jgi:hypothetical protein
MPNGHIPYAGGPAQPVGSPPAASRPPNRRTGIVAIAIAIVVLAVLIWFFAFRAH